MNEFKDWFEKMSNDTQILVLVHAKLNSLCEHDPSGKKDSRIRESKKLIEDHLGMDVLESDPNKKPK